MHIKFEDENLLIQNIQIFLKENYDRHLQLSGVYDVNTHRALINYLKKPNTATVQEVKAAIIQQFTYRDTIAPYNLVDGGGIFNFDHKLTPNEILFYTKPRHTFFDAGLEFIGGHIDELKQCVESFGWTVTEYTNYTYVENLSRPNNAIIRIRKTGIKNVFPNRTVLPMINLFEGTYLYKRCFLDEQNKYEGYIQSSPNYKIAVIPCEPGDTFTISHGYGVECEMAVAYTSATLKQLRSEEMIPVDSDNILSRMAYSPKGMISPGKWDYYSVPSDSNASYLLVQMPYRSDMVSTQTRTCTIKKGDINNDGVIDSKDVELLNEWVTANEKNLPVPFEMTGTTLIAANITGDLDLDGNPIISRDDVTVLQEAIQNGRTETLGNAEYEQQIRVSEFELDRLLVMYGDDAKDDTLNIPISSFYEDTWAVHEKFVEYFLGRVIHKYSNIEDIAWLREQIKNYTGVMNSNVSKYDEPEDYYTGDYIKFDESSTKWKYYRNNVYSGFYLSTNNDVTNGIIKRDDGVSSNMKIVNSRIYTNDTFDGRIVLEDGRVVNSEGDYSLRQQVKNLQKLFNDSMEHDNVDFAERIQWSDGYFDNKTERLLRLANGSTYQQGAFR